ncbi:MAG: trypsin-like peptidase domain-containing protein, partial [Blastocatellia bacterium]
TYDHQTPVNTQPITTQHPPRRSYVGWVVLGVTVLALLVSMAVVQAGYLRHTKYTGTANATLPEPHAVVADSAPSPGELSNTFRKVAKAVEPAVVYISVTETVQSQSVFPSFPGFGGPMEQSPRKASASGSGVIVRPDGFILTNNHVVGKADKIKVTLADGRTFNAEKVGTDPATDLAVIKINASSLPIAILGDSEKIEQGDWVLAIGSPFGFQQTLTAGIVSATGRSLQGPDTSQLDRYIQTDASINPGNSGGPLVDMQGEVIGINTLIYSPSTPLTGNSQGGNIGIGFAIPSDLARRIYEQLASSGKVTRGYLGVWVKDLDEPTAKALHVDPHGGVLVSDVTSKDSPAAKAGLMSGDVVTAIDGKQVHKATELTDSVVDLPVGHKAVIDYIRDGEHRTATVLLTERPATSASLQPESGNDNEDESQPQSSKLGLAVQSITPDVASEMNLKVGAGALVVNVEAGGPAEEAGISRGDVIHRVGSQEIRNAQDLIQATKSLKSGDSVALQVEHRGQMIFVTINID